MDDSIEIWSGENAGKPFMEPDEFGKAIEAIMSEGPADTPQAGTQC